MASNFGLYFREELPEPVARELDSQLSRIWGVLLEEHADDGTHLSSNNTPLFQTTRSIVVSGTSTQTIANETKTRVTLTNVELDKHHEYDITNARMVPKIGGLWLFGFAGKLNTLSGRLTTYIDKNGVTSGGRIGLFPSQSVDVGSSLVVVVDMNGTGDYVDFHVLHNHGSDRDLNTNSFAFGVYLGVAQ
ncbi:MAG: hypothetical protein AB7J46_06425 [Candidatus Altimarinota bacterium]